MLKRTSMKQGRSEKMTTRYKGGRCTYCRGVGFKLELQRAYPSGRAHAMGVKVTCRSCDGTGTSGGRAAIVSEVLAARPSCEVSKRLIGVIGRLRVDQSHDLDEVRVLCNGIHFALQNCSGAAVDVHERLPRSAGGSIIDRTNFVTCCRMCHDFVETHRKLAISVGLLDSRYEGRTEMMRISS